MHDNRAGPLWPGDLRGAFGLLTRLPLGGPGRGAAGCWAWPVAGAVVGALGAVAGWGALALGLPAGWAAALALAVQAMATGGLHEDGLADTFDGLMGGRDPARRLEIMRDSRIGAFGALALMLVLLARWSALVVILPIAPWVLIAAAAASRAVMPVLMAAMPPARPDGLSRLMGRPTAAQAGLAVLVALVPLAIFGPLAALIAVPLLLLALGRWAKARIGGQTGDILGAAQQLTEALILGFLAATP
ncbi:MAG: adenosylcobinamide-GDP ribazoletransferase [Rhodobacterales bacterium]|nr:adenosylcobinamide-GDP ribazoletransferase [Rhodobacterales bacterium]MDX5498757.1 adenosylcobinamide-GDP ribazoletransferase [Rhodobacterales bacterium]